MIPHANCLNFMFLQSYLFFKICTEGQCLFWNGNWMRNMFQRSSLKFLFLLKWSLDAEASSSLSGSSSSSSSSSSDASSDTSSSQLMLFNVGLSDFVGENGSRDSCLEFSEDRLLKRDPDEPAESEAEPVDPLFFNLILRIFTIRIRELGSTVFPSIVVRYPHAPVGSQ